MGGVGGRTSLPAARSGKLRVFISYGRDDLDFADQLDATLRLAGFDTSIDRHAISGGEEWKARLGNLIREADTVVFVLSPSSAVSKICAWEVEQAVSNGKRIIPVVARPLESAAAPEHLRDLNYIFFYVEPKFPGSGFGPGLLQLADALSTDFGWLREHTRLLQRATEWQAGGRSENRLLSGGDITAAKDWASHRPKGAPEPTALQMEFLRASEDAESARENTTRRALEERERLVSAEEAAQRERDAATRRVFQRTLIGIGVAVVLTLLAGGIAQYARKQKESVDELIERIGIGRSNRYGIEAMKKICGEAVEVTSGLAAAAASSVDFSGKENRFWELYYGPMNIVEMREKTENYSGGHGSIVASAIESAMVEFGWKLENMHGRVEHTPLCANLEGCAANIRKECEGYLQRAVRNASIK